MKKAYIYILLSYAFAYCTYEFINDENNQADDSLSSEIRDDEGLLTHILLVRLFEDGNSNEAAVQIANLIDGHLLGQNEKTKSWQFQVKLNRNETIDDILLQLRLHQRVQSVAIAPEEAIVGERPVKYDTSK